MPEHIEDLPSLGVLKFVEHCPINRVEQLVLQPIYVELKFKFSITRDTHLIIYDLNIDHQFYLDNEQARKVAKSYLFKYDLEYDKYIYKTENWWLYFDLIKCDSVYFMAGHLSPRPGTHYVREFILWGELDLNKTA